MFASGVLPDRVLSRTSFAPSALGTGCWVWQGTRGPNGYGKISILRDGRWRVEYLHRWAWTEFRSPIEPGLEIDHLCRVRACFNPDHLEPVTTKVNHERRAALVTHCPRGHEYSPENTRLTKNNKRACLTCCRERDRLRWPGRAEARRARREACM